MSFIISVLQFFCSFFLELLVIWFLGLILYFSYFSFDLFHCFSVSFGFLFLYIHFLLDTLLKYTVIWLSVYILKRCTEYLIRPGTTWDILISLEYSSKRQLFHRRDNLFVFFRTTFSREDWIFQNSAQLNLSQSASQEKGWADSGIRNAILKPALHLLIISR